MAKKKRRGGSKKRAAGRTCRAEIRVLPESGKEFAVLGLWAFAGALVGINWGIWFGGSDRA